MNNKLSFEAITQALAEVNGILEEIGDCKYRANIERIGMYLGVAGAVMIPTLLDEDEDDDVEVKLSVDAEALSKAVSENTGYVVDAVSTIIHEACDLLDIDCKED